MNSDTPVSAAPRKNCLPLLVVFFPPLTPAQAQVLRSHFCLPGCASCRGEGSVYVASGECPLLPGRPRAWATRKHFCSESLCGRVQLVLLPSNNNMHVHSPGSRLSSSKPVHRCVNQETWLRSVQVTLSFQ